MGEEKHRKRKHQSYDIDESSDVRHHHCSDSDESSSDNHDCKCDSMKDTDECITCVVCSQASVSQCEAKLFCEVTQRLSKEVHKAKDAKQLAHVIDLINSFLIASASKEKSIASIIKASTHKKKIKIKKHDCC